MLKVILMKSRESKKWRHLYRISRLRVIQLSLPHTNIKKIILYLDLDFIHVTAGFWSTWFIKGSFLANFNIQIDWDLFTSEPCCLASFWSIWLQEDLQLKLDYGLNNSFMTKYAKQTICCLVFKVLSCSDTIMRTRSTWRCEGERNNLFLFRHNSVF